MSYRPIFKLKTWYLFILVTIYYVTFLKKIIYKTWKFDLIDVDFLESQTTCISSHCFSTPFQPSQFYDLNCCPLITVNCRYCVISWLYTFYCV